MSITDQVYALLRDRIVQRALAPGERVDIDLLAQELEVSRTPVREALTKLSGEGLISVLPRRGTFVSQPSAKEFLDLLDLRLGLELWAARKSIETLSEADLHRMERMYEEMVEAVARLEESPYQQYLSFVELNQQFHGTIVQSSGNAKLYETYRSVDLAAQIQRVIFPVTKETLDRSNGQHSQILKALRQRHWPSVEKAMTAHVETVKQDVLQSLEMLTED